MFEQSKIAHPFTIRLVLFILIASLISLPLQAFAIEGEDGTLDTPTARTLVDEVATEQDPNSEVIDFEAMTVVIRRLPNTYFAAVTGFLNPEIQLPATVEIAVPAGSHIIWFGEPSEQGPIGADPTFDNPDVRTEGDFDIYTVTLENEHHVQIEYNLFSSPVADRGDGTYTLRMEYTPLTELQALRFMTNLPAGAQIIDEDLEFYGLNSEDERQYGRTYREVAAGQLISTDLNYNAPRFAGTPNESRLVDGLLVTGIVMLVGVAGALSLVIITKRRRESSSN